jgi:hypothetical protein
VKATAPESRRTPIHTAAAACRYAFSISGAKGPLGERLLAGDADPRGSVDRNVTPRSNPEAA